jgi:hypothetical protein
MQCKVFELFTSAYLLAVATLMLSSAAAAEPFARPPIGEQTPNASRNAGEAAPHRLSDLDPVTRASYLDMRASLRTVQRELAQANRDAEHADPALAVARRLNDESSTSLEQLRSKLSLLEQEYVHKNPAQATAFRHWSDCAQRQAASDRLNQMAADQDERPLFVWYFRVLLTTMLLDRHGLPAELIAIGPAEPAKWNDVQVMAAFNLLRIHPVRRKQGVSIDLATDCSELQKDLKLSAK